MNVLTSSKRGGMKSIYNSDDALDVFEIMNAGKN